MRSEPMLQNAHVSARIPVQDLARARRFYAEMLGLMPTEERLKTVKGIATVQGNYPSKGGVGERGAWFKDSEGNLLSIGQPVR
jgi:hypothetical protein